MKSFKKIYLILLITISMIICGNIYATTISLSKTNPTVGENVTVTVKVSNVATWQLTVSYDSSKLQLVSGSTNLVRGDDGVNNVSTTAGTLVFKTKATGTANINVTGNSYKADYTSVPAGASTNINISAVPPKPAPTPTTPPPTTTVSKNANLKSLTLNVEGLNPSFSKSRLNYSLNVTENVESIDVKAIAEDSKATVYVTGHKKLSVGNNTISITVTAPDKVTKKTYKISVVKSNNPEFADATLDNLIVENVDLGVEFDPNVTVYNCSDIDYNITKLNILAYPTNENAKVEIFGNEEFKVGENTITIKVTSQDGSVTREYFLKFNKKDYIEEVHIYEETDSLIDDENSKVGGFVYSLWMYLKKFWLVITLFIFCLFEFGQIVYLYKKINKLKAANLTITENDEDEADILTPRRRSATLEDNNEEVIDDISDELVDEEETGTIEIEDNTDNFDDIKEIDEDKEENK